MAEYLFNLRNQFAQVVAQFGDRTALLLDDGSSLTYKELDAFSSQIAAYFWQNGVRKRDRIGICMEKSALAYATIVACWKTGATYFAMDPKNPSVRLERIISQCDPKFILSEVPLASQWQPRIIAVENGTASVFSEASHEPFAPRALEGVDGSDPAYIMFTSGSTGTPKGVVISTQNVLNFIKWSHTEYSFSEQEIFSNLNPLYFDNSVFDIYSSLFAGATLVSFNSKTISDPLLTVQRLGATGCTVFFSVPSLLIYLQTLKVIKQAKLPALRTIIFGGEGYPKPKLKELFDDFHPHARLFNVYGPTECTCICSSYLLSAADFAEIEGLAPLGTMIRNFHFSILDSDQKPVPAGTVGELYLGGPCVGHGYFRQPDETSRSFVQNPLNANFPEKVYKTGDLVMVSPKDGKVYFSGRKDSQIKHMGYRIELDEVQHGLMTIPGINEAVALHVKTDTKSQIISVVSAASGLVPDAIKEEARRRLPSYMVPNKIIVLNQLPKNANGKIDKQILKEQYATI